MATVSEHVCDLPSVWSLRLPRTTQCQAVGVSRGCQLMAGKHFSWWAG